MQPKNIIELNGSCKCEHWVNDINDSDKWWLPGTCTSGGCFNNVSRALQNDLAKIHNAKNHIWVENFKLKLCTCAQSMALGTRTKFQLEILIRGTISAIHNFRDNILETSRNISETTPWCTKHTNADLLSIRPSETNFNETFIPIQKN